MQGALNKGKREENKEEKTWRGGGKGDEERKGAREVKE